MLGRIRGALSPVSSKVGKFLSKYNVNPTTLTLLGVITALLTPVAGYYGLGTLIPLLIAISSILDWLDGAVARASLRESKLGAFADSVGDRVSDVAYLIALRYLGINVFLILLAIPTSLLVSYVRCRAESLNISLEGMGIAERGERVLLVILIAITSLITSPTYGNYILTLMVILNSLTIIQRVIHVIKVLRGR